MIATTGGGLPARATGKVRKEHAGFQKVIQKGGVWEIVKGRGRAATQPPQWLWDGLATFAPEVCAHISTSLETQLTLAGEQR